MSEQLLSTKAKFEVVWEALRRLGIKQVDVTFSGEGDSGSIDDLCVGDLGETTNETSMIWAKLNEVFQTALVTLDGAPIKLRELMEELIDPILTGNECGVDWWNNDGGFGEARWILNEGDEPPMIEVDISERIVNTVDHSFEFDRHGEQPADEPAS